MKAKLAILGIGPPKGGPMSDDEEEAPPSSERGESDAGGDDADTAAMGDELAAAIKSGDGKAVYAAFKGMMAACQADEG